MALGGLKYYAFVLVGVLLVIVGIDLSTLPAAQWTLASAVTLVTGAALLTRVAYLASDR